MTKILFFLGIAFCVAGIVTGNITANWSTIPITLLALGVGLFVIDLWLWGNKHKFWQKRSTKSGTSAMVSTLIVLVLLGAINFLAIRYGMRWDLTENQQFTLSDQSQTILQNLDKPLEVLVFDRNNNSDLENLLNNYRRQSEKFTYKFINPEQDIGIAQQFGVESLGEIYLQYGDKKQRLNTNNAALGEAITESQLTNGIEKIKRDRTTNIYLLQGHGEAPLEPVEGGLIQAINTLRDKGNTVQELNLASSGTIPENADLIIIAGATRKLFAAEVSSLQQYLQAGGNLLLMLSPNADIGITPLLQKWGIELDNRLIIDGSGAGSLMGFGPGVAIVNNYGDHPITTSFRNGISIFPESRPLTTTTNPDIESTPLAITTKQTWAESNLASEEITFDSATDLSGPLNVAIALSRNQPQKSRLVVFGSSTFATNGWFEQQLNGDILLNSVSWLIGEDQDTLSIRPKEAANRRINLSSAQAGAISWLALRIMPLLALIIAGVLWWQRR
ncbi:Gldg family protein [Pleurocapsa sp. PCC 7319]|uniref:GldG family protein n=1 Tax=Pleurocapsa sp. PCC 7319 TaxID=118161 RepID=UPI000345F030|nr:Gldg family protein [Pleurocapsa sp. PCC 7319]